MIKCSLVIVFSILLFFLSANGQQQDGSVLEKRITINETDKPLNTILDQLSWQTGVYFSYDATIIDSNKNYSVNANGISLYTVLNQLFNSDIFNFTELENQVIITKKSNPDFINSVKKDSIHLKYFFLSGKIIDDKKGEPIPYATISILNKPIGTISNTDGDFLLKIHPDLIRDTIIISCMGYAQFITPAFNLLDEDVFIMKPVSIRIREVKVTSTTPENLLKNIREKIQTNYSTNTDLMTAFYRETVQQDGSYISASEAVIEILKASYNSMLKTDLVRLIKGRRSRDIKPLNWINFKLQGGPFTITKLDVIKTMESFIDKDNQHLYNYNVSKVIWYNNYPVYVLNFKPVTEFRDQTLYEGELYVHRETFAVVHAEFYLSKTGLKNAQNVLIQKKPKGVKARPIYVNYTVNYQFIDSKWKLANAQASVKFKIRNRSDKLNSEFHSISDLLITDIQPTDLKRFDRDESIGQRDIFVEIINGYDPEFWENYNIIKPNEELQNAIKNRFENRN